jgi:iron complex transport system substrate-binding protein
MAGGNWMPELIAAAGGDNLFGQAGKHSGWMQWPELAAADPDVIIVGPCGYDLRRCLEELPLLEAKPGWARLSAVCEGRVYFTDGNAYFNRPGPRLADSAEMLAEMIHPAAVRARHDGAAWVQASGSGRFARLG